MTDRVAVIGSGSWGTALAIAAHHTGAAVTLFSRNDAQTQEINTTHTNGRALPNIILSQSITATSRLADVASYPVVVLAVPAQVTRAMCQQLKSYLAPNAALVLTAKGIEHGSCALMSDIVQEELPHHPFVVLSGPTFAKEVAQGLPTALTLASSDATAERLRTVFTTPFLRPYLSEDVIGVQIGGAVKNVLAIAAGVVEGAGLGDNARAALICRGLAELVRLGIAKGGKLETFLGLSGCGDVVLTCTSRQSRNMSYGIELAQGTPQDGVLREGFHTAQTIMTLANTLQVDMPICNSVHRLVTGKSSVKEELKALLARPLQHEASSLNRNGAI